MEIFVKIVNIWKPLTIFAKISILNLWMGSEWASMSGYTLYKNEILLTYSISECGQINILL